MMDPVCDGDLSLKSHGHLTGLLLLLYHLIQNTTMSTPSIDSSIRFPGYSYGEKVGYTGPGRLMHHKIAALDSLIHLFP